MKYTATITFEVDDNVDANDVYNMIESDLSSGEFFVKNEEFGGDHCHNICVHFVTPATDENKLFCPYCGKTAEKNSH